MRFSLRSRASSSRSAVVRPVRPPLRSARARSTHGRKADSVRSNSRATAPTVFPSSNTSRTAPARNSSLHCRRDRRRVVAAIRDIVSTFRNVSTRSDQVHLPSMEPRLRSRGSVDKGLIPAVASLPSMEPRLRSRGSELGALQGAMSAFLQWSRGCEAAEASLLSSGASLPGTFNGAAAAKPRKQVARSQRLPVRPPSMEPRLRSRGSTGSVLLGWVGFVLQWSRGSGEARRGPVPGRGPSMEPRLRSRGSLVIGTSPNTLTYLQWSRGCEAAEARGFGRGMNAPAFLQWSRGCEAAEAQIRGSRCWRRAAFNGAAAAKPRKQPGRRRRFDGIPPSMEPRLRSRGSLSPVVDLDVRLRPSMEPRLRSRGSYAV